MLEIEAPGHPVHIKQFAGKKQTLSQAALHRGEVDLPQGHTACRHELLAEGAAATDRINAGIQGRHQALLLLAAQVSPTLRRINPVSRQEMKPQAPAQLRPGSPVGELAPGLLPPRQSKGLLQLRTRPATAPVDPQPSPVATLLEGTRGKCRQPQGGRTTQAPVGDQGWTPLTKALIWQHQLQLDRIHHHSAERPEGVGLQGQGEQGGHWGHQAVTKLDRQLTATGMAAGGQQQMGAAQPLLALACPIAAEPQMQPKPPLGQQLNRPERRPPPEADPGSRRRALQQLGNGAGAIAAGKQTPIRLLDQLQAALGEPGHRVAGGKAAERPPQRLSPPRVMPHQGPWIPAGMGDIAAATATEQHLAERLRSGLQQQHASHPLLRSRDGGHVTGWPAASHHQEPVEGQHGGMGEGHGEPAAIPAAYRFSVAPMMDCTDRHFRVLMRQITRHSLLYTEMVVAQALHHGRRDTLLDFDPCEKPLALQVGGDDPVLLAEAARLAAAWGYDEVNLNVGCPSERVQKGRFGACLMAEPAHLARCVEAMASGPLPVTVKHRIGIDDRDSYPELLHFVDSLAAAGAARFSVHARKAWLSGLDPKQNRTVPPLRYDLVHRLKRERPGLRFELNGGLLELATCQAQLEHVDGVMVGRAAYDHPLRWGLVDRDLFGVVTSPAPSASAVLRGLIPYADRWCDGGGRLWPIARHLVHLVEAVPGARQWRRRLGEAAAARNAGPEVLDQAAAALEQQGL